MFTEKSNRDEFEEEKIKKALIERPGFSIKARLSLFLLILFFITAFISGGGMYMFYKIDTRVQYIYLADKIANEIQHARRIEKNYLLYNANLSEIRKHLNNANDLLEKASREFGFVVGKNEINNLRKNLQKYKQLAELLISKSNDSIFINNSKFSSTVASFRQYGSNILELSLDISKKERELVSTTISFAQKVFILLLVVFIITLIYIIINLSKHLISRLNRLMEATQRLAAGDFTPITPKRKYKDEFSFLAIAFNHMMYELEKRQNLLIESHKLRAIGNFTAGIAHELNNPLNNIIITSEMLKEDFKNLDDEERLDMLNDIVIQGDRAHQIVNNLLDYARESKTKTEHFYINNLIEKALRLVKNQFKLSKVKIIKEIENNLPPIYGDIKLFTQVFVNLFINAIDAMPNGGTLSIKIKQDTKLAFINVKVSDTGVGIPPHLIKSIFNPFFTTKPEGAGTGLGLSVSQSIIQKHGGNISVSSEIEKGTTFTIHLPTVSMI